VFPTWVGVVTALSLAVIALAALAVAAATAAAALGMRASLRALQTLAGPALDDARHLVATIRTEVDGLAGTSRELRERVLKAADAAQARLTELDALADAVQAEVQSTAMDIAATIRTLRRGVSVLDFGRRAVKRERAKPRRER